MRPDGSSRPMFTDSSLTQEVNYPLVTLAPTKMKPPGWDMSSTHSLPHAGTDFSLSISVMQSIGEAAGGLWFLSPQPLTLALDKVIICMAHVHSLKLTKGTVWSNNLLLLTQTSTSSCRDNRVC